MSAVWLSIAVATAATIALKSAGPVFVGGRDLPPRLAAVVALLAPALLAALVVSETVGGDRGLVLDARLAGIAAACAALIARAPVLVTVGLAAAVTALVRAVG